MTWRKLGRVYCASAGQGWAASHAYCPTPVALDGGDRIRVLCAFLDTDRVGRCGWVDVDARQPARVLGVSEHAVLDVGAPGSFDEHGVTPLCVVPLDGGRLRLYYAGWQRDVGVRYTLFTGVAESDDEGESFARLSPEPALAPTAEEPHVRSSSFVLRGGEGWRMWYAAGFEWREDGAGAARPRYAMRTLESVDGLAWPNEGRLCFAPGNDELGFARPYVRRDGGWRMWYSRRALDGAYRLGYAESGDGEDWHRQDEAAGLASGAPGEWDAQMVGLAGHLTTPHGTLLFYNGNGYGETGFGVAIAEGL